MNLSGQVLDSSVVSRGIESTSLVRARQEIRRASLRKSAHAFSYQAGDLESDYTPPAVDGSGTGHVHTDYNLDRQVWWWPPTESPRTQPRPMTLRRGGSRRFPSAAGRTRSAMTRPAEG